MRDGALELASSEPPRMVALREFKYCHNHLMEDKEEKEWTR